MWKNSLKYILLTITTLYIMLLVGSIDSIPRSWLPWSILIMIALILVTKLIFNPNVLRKNNKR